MDHRVRRYYQSPELGLLAELGTLQRLPAGAQRTRVPDGAGGRLSKMPPWAGTERINIPASFLLLLSSFLAFHWLILHGNQLATISVPKYTVRAGEVQKQI